MPEKYLVEVAPEARADLRDPSTVRPFLRRPIIHAIEELEHQAEIETKHRKPLAEPLQELPDASWEVVVGEHRVLYQVKPNETAEAESELKKTARVLRVIVKGRVTTREAVARARKQ